ncbi:MAG TPA: TAXI family TRAP transporter solute-binding subunit [Acidobacteriota bacterium]|nr:TAXI family TRAP transporter solute-binding subunit [Acidobacteriota bacterium]
MAGSWHIFIRSCLIAALLWAAFLGRAGPLAGGQETGRAIHFCSGRPAGNYNRLAQQIARHPFMSDFQLEVKTTQGSYDNTGMLRSGECDIALVQNDVAAAEHLNGRPYRALASLYDEIVHVAARRELGFDQISDLVYSEKSLRIGIGELGSGSASHALMILDELNLLSRKAEGPPWETLYIRLGEALEELRFRNLDVVFVTSAVPVTSLVEASQQDMITLLEIDQNIIQSLRSKQPYLSLCEIPYDVYSGKRNIASLGLRALLVLGREVPADVVAPLLEAVYDLPGHEGLPFLADLTPLTGLSDITIPIHPSSRRYHEEHRAELARLVQEYKDYLMPVIILLIPFLLLRSRTALFIHQFTLGRILVLLVCVWLGGASTMFIVEGSKNSAFDSFGKSAIAILHYLFSGLESKYPITPAGTVVSILILSLGAAVVALFTATIVSILVEQAFGIQRLRTKPRLFKLRDHVIIAGWSKRSERLIRHLRSGDLAKKPPIAVITSDSSKTTVRNRHHFKNVWVVEGRPCQKSTLARANATTAKFALLLSDDPGSEESELQNVASTLAIEALKPSVYTMAEANSHKTEEHLKSCRVNQVVNVSDLSEKLVSQSVITPRVMGVYDELLTFARQSQEIYFLPLNRDLANSTFGQIQRQLPRSRDAIAVGFRRNRVQIVLNPRKFPESNDHPGAHTRLSPEDELIIMADTASALRKPAWQRLWRKLRKETSGGKVMSTIDQLQLPKRSIERQDIRIGICGWNPGSRDIITQLQAPIIRRRYRYSFKVICPMTAPGVAESDKSGAPEDVSFVFGDPLKREVLKNAGVEDFRTLVILADRSSREAAKYSDHRSLMVALAARDLKGDIHLVVEVLESENREHFERLKNAEIVSVEDLAEKIMAQSVISPGITEVFERLLTASMDSNEIYLTPVPEEWLGCKFRNLYQKIVDSREEVCLLGYESLTSAGERVLVLNPSRDRRMRRGTVNWQQYEFKEGDSLILMAYELPDW